MDLLQKIELGIVLLVLVFHVLFIVSNPDVVSNLFHHESKQVLSAPSDFITEDKIIAYPDKLVLEIGNYSLSRYAPTGSMIPMLDSSADGVGIKPKSADDLHVGDVITFRKDGELIVHRIVEKGIDDEGDYFITKGDNNNITDGKVRFSQVDSVLVAIIY